MNLLDDWAKTVQLPVEMQRLYAHLESQGFSVVQQEYRRDAFGNALLVLTHHKLGMS